MAEEVEMTPITPAEAEAVPPKVSPFAAPPAATASAAPAASATPAAPAAAPAAPASSGASSTVSTIKLKPIIRKPVIRKPVIGGAGAPSAAVAKKSTQNLKSATGTIPAQATLRKTGIIAEGILTPAQQQAAKSKTSRISLESAIGVAPVKESPAPMKTIRLRRPTDLKHSTPAPLASAAAPAPASAPASAPAAEPTPTVADGNDSTVTQAKTLKLHRPTMGISRPTLGVNRGQAKPAAPAADGDVPELSVAELQTVANLASPMQTASGGATSAGVPGWVAALSLVTSLAALVAVGALMWYLWQEGVGPAAGANEMPFIEM